MTKGHFCFVHRLHQAVGVGKQFCIQANGDDIVFETVSREHQLSLVAACCISKSVTNRWSGGNFSYCCFLSLV